MNLPHPVIARRLNQNGSTVLVLLILLTIMLLLAAANSRALIHLRGELNLLNQRQVERLKIATPPPAAPVSPAIPEPK